MTAQKLRYKAWLAAAGSIALLILSGAFGLVHEARGDTLSSVVDKVTPVTDVVVEATAPVTAPLPVSPPSDLIPNSGSSAPSKSPSVKLPAIAAVPQPSSAPITTAPTDPAAVVGDAGSATETVAAAQAEVLPESGPGTGSGNESPEPAAEGAAAENSKGPAEASPQPNQVALKGLQLAAVGNWFIRVWPAVALDRTFPAGLLSAWKGESSGSVSGAFASLVENAAEALPGGSGSIGSADRVSAPPADSGSSLLGRWISAEPSLPLAVFWIGLAGAVALIGFVVRRELGPPSARRRWRY